MNDLRDRFRDHEKFDELTAVAISGTLSATEQAEMNDHLRVCEECRKAYSDYVTLVRDGIPVLAGSYDYQEASGQELFPHLGLARRQESAHAHAPKFAEPSSLYGLSHIVTHAAALMAVSACLVVAFGVVKYRTAQRKEAVARHAVLSAQDNVQRLTDAKKAAIVSLSDQAENLAQLQHESSQRRQEIDNLRSELNVMRDRSDELARSKGVSDEQLRAVSQQRDLFMARLEEIQGLYEKGQVELVRLSSEREATLSLVTSVEEQVEELSGVNREAESEIKEQEGYLASDRDIRELMGARNLYIADVFDVDSDSHTQKAFGRVFYTQGKSLVFYAFDLDLRPGIKKGATFQAWGRRESEQGKPLNLGILYMDNVSNRRWALRFDDPVELSKINAVFVTAEPNGGSREPTAKPFLYALLRAKANHP